MKNVMAEIRDIITAHRAAMAEVELNGLRVTAETVAHNLLKLECWLEFEQHAARKMAAKTQDWKWARACYKASYLIHDKHRYELEHAVAELDMDLKTLKSRLNPTAADYHAHPWNIDVDVYIYDESDATEASDITSAEIQAYVDAITKCLRGEFGMINDGTPGARGFGFYADAADEDTLNELLAGLEKRGCIVEYPDWDYIHAIGNRKED